MATQKTRLEAEGDPARELREIRAALLAFRKRLDKLERQIRERGEA